MSELAATEKTNRDSSLKGKAVEHLVAATCILIGNGALNVSTSFVDDEGVDLVFHHRGGSTTLAVQVKARFTGSRQAENGFVLANVSASTFVPRRDLYMLFVLVDASAGSFGPVWFVPSSDFAELTRASPRGRHRFQGSLKATSNDRWRRYRCDRLELPSRIMEALAVLETERNA
jgi:hypothetical protein